jgi:hypothetical protein
MVSEVVCEDAAMFDPVLAVSPGGVRRSCFTAPGVKESRVAVVVAEYLGNQLVGIDFSTQSRDLLLW